MCCVYFCLPDIINPMYILQLREIVPPPSQNTLGVCNQITFLIQYYINSRLVTLLKVIDAPIQVSYISYLTLSYVKLPTLLWFGPCNHCISACFLCSKKRKHSSSYHSLCCFNSYIPRLSLAEILIFSLMFSKALFMSLPSFKFSEAEELFKILIL